MSESRPSSARVRRVGSDLVFRDGERLVVESNREMEHWEVRRHRQTLIHFDNQTWRVVGKASGHTHRFRYELEPWLPAPMEHLGVELDYGAEVANLRDRQHARSRRQERLAASISLFLPLLGLLGSSTKKRLEQSHAIDPVAATKASLYLELVVLFASCTLLVISTMVGMYGHNPPWNNGYLLAVVMVCAADLIFRYHSLLGEERYPPGFLQWVLPLPRWR